MEEGQKIEIIQWNHLCYKIVAHLTFERPVCPALLVLLHSMKTLLLLLTHHSNYHQFISVSVL